MKLMAVDSNSIMNRAFYGIRLLSNKDGIYTNALVGFLNIMLKVMDETKADAFAFAFDRKEPTFRHKKFAEYKAGRKEMPEELAMQFPLLKELLEHLGYSVLETPGFEADDILGTLGRLSREQKAECTIVTGDRDCLQLVSNEVSVRLATTKAGQPAVTFYDTKAILDAFGLYPKQLIDVKALQGDSSDNIPGVSGIGEKTALMLIQNFGTLEGVYHHLTDDKIKPGMRQKLEMGHDTAFFSRELGKIVTNAPILEDLSHYQKGQGDPAKAAAMLNRLGMVKLKERLGLSDIDLGQLSFFKGEEPFAEKKKPTHEVVFSLEGETLQKLLTAKKLWLFVPMEKERPTALAVSDGTQLFWLDGKETGFENTLQILLSSPVPKVLWDSKSLYHYAFSNGFVMAGVDFDLALAGYILNPLDRSYEPQKLLEEYGTEIPVIIESGELALVALAAMMSVESRMQKEIHQNQQDMLLYEVEQPLSKVLASMEVIGFDVDEKGITDFGEHLNGRIHELEEAIYEEAGETFNINSPKQLGEILFDKMGLPKGKKTKTGYSTNVDVLEELRDKSPMVGDVLEYRQLAKLKSTYVEGLLKVVGSDGRMHTKFNQTETRTGRISSTEPNMQNIPVRTDLGREMRRFFRAESGNLLLDADYSQIELRVLAALSGDENMLAAFRSGEDIHTITASQVFHVPIEMVTPKMRSDSKAVNFGIVYGISAFSLSGDIGVSVQDAQAYINGYLETFSGVQKYMEQSIAFGKEHGYVETLFHRRRPLPELKAKNYNERSFGERVARNMPIQGTAADIIKIAMVRVFERLEKEGQLGRLILQVHDELIIEAPAGEAKGAAALLKEEMENAADLGVRLLVDVGEGSTWYDAKG